MTDNVTDTRIWFTKGPWAATKYGYEKYAIADERGTEIGFVHRGRDAHLIAAAPALYAIGEKLLTIFDHPTRSVTMLESDELRAALKQARGEA